MGRPQAEDATITDASEDPFAFLTTIVQSVRALLAIIHFRGNVINGNSRALAVRTLAGVPT